ncbi:TetR/AcrR family transcriptional regulator [Gordonia soli]|nr:helix-turn-helix domain-containing protein [Gordonia soli]
MTEQEADVPEVLNRLWGAQTPGRRGPKAALSVDAIVRGAVEIAETDGLDAVSMARVGKALGYSAMALYRHVADKDELLLLMSDAVGGLMELPDLDGMSWRAAMELWTRTQIECMVARPWILDLPLSATAPGPQRLRWVDAAFDALVELDLSFAHKLEIIGILSQYVLGEARVVAESQRTAADIVRREAGLDPATPIADLDPDALAAADPYAAFEVVLTKLAGPERFPAITAALADADDDDASDDDSWIGLSVMLDGIEKFVEGRRRG